MMHMPVREGLNLWPLEFVYAHKEPATPGVVIASEFSAISSILNGAVRVNPWDVLMSVSTIDSALSMSSDERDARRGRDIDFVSNSPSGMWTRNVLRDLNDATQNDPSNREALLGNPAESLDMLAIEKLELRSLESAYKMSKKRVIIIDFNGTLVVKEPPTKYLKREILGTSGFKPSAIASQALGKLCQDPNNVVYVVSGDTQPNLEAAVGDIAGLGLAASNGACFADPGSQGKWTYLNFGVDWQAVQKVGFLLYLPPNRFFCSSNYIVLDARLLCLSSPNSLQEQMGPSLNSHTLVLDGPTTHAILSGDLFRVLIW